MPFFGLMTVRAHEAAVASKSATDQLLVAGYIDQLFELSEQRDAETKRANELAAEMVALKVELEAKPIHNQEDVARGDRWRDRAFAQAREMETLKAELATLRPDAEKHRERVRKASMNLKQNRAKAAPAVRLEAAEPPADPYDTARDSRRDDREIHSL